MSTESTESTEYVSLDALRCMAKNQQQLEQQGDTKYRSIFIMFMLTFSGIFLFAFVCMYLRKVITKKIKQLFSNKSQITKGL